MAADEAAPVHCAPRRCRRRCSARRAAPSNVRRKSRASASLTMGRSGIRSGRRLREAGYIDGQTIAYEYRVGRRRSGAARGGGDGTGAPSGRPDRDLWHAGEPRRQGRHFDDPDRRHLPSAIRCAPVSCKAWRIPAATSPATPSCHRTSAPSGCNSSRRSSRRPSAWRCFGIPDNVSNAMILEQLRDAAPGLGLEFTAVEARNAGDFDRRICHPGARAAGRGAVHQRSGAPEPHPEDHLLPVPAGSAGNVPNQGQCRGRRPDVLWRELSRHCSAKAHSSRRRS